MVQSRRGLTKITSVSVSNEFAEIINKYNLSPTEIFRKGMGVTLYSLGIQEYNTEINNLRHSKAMEILNNIDKQNELRERIRAIKEALEKLDLLFSQLNKTGGYQI